jgi:hypothetical protein
MTQRKNLKDPDRDQHGYNCLDWQKDPSCCSRAHSCPTDGLTNWLLETNNIFSLCKFCLTNWTTSGQERNLLHSSSCWLCVSPLQRASFQDCVSLSLSKIYFELSCWPCSWLWKHRLTNNDKGWPQELTRDEAVMSICLLFVSHESDNCIYLWLMQSPDNC